MIHTWSHGSADDSMPEDILLSLEPLIRVHPWWRARATLLLALLDRIGVGPRATVLDAGCGWGVTLHALEQRGYCVDGLDISRCSLERIDRSDRELIEADLVKPIPKDAKTYDTVVALDVIEHIDDDRAAVRNLCLLTKPGGVAIVSVPALPDLFTEFDRVQGHRRRYMPASLKQAFIGSGFTVEQLFWWGGWLIPLLRLQRARRRSRLGMTSAQIYAEYVKPPRWPLSSLLRAAFMVDQYRTLSGKIKRGTSLFVVARRSPI